MTQKDDGTPARGPVTIPPRRRIWQLEAGKHCSVLGTCLSLQDLHVIARRARYQVDPTTSAYVLHSWFVDMMAEPNDLAKLVDKELEKRHGTTADTVRRACSEREIEARWKEGAERGNLAGAYWGAMSHPLCSEELQWRLFGEIHMLSHMVGSSRRADLARVHDLEASCAASEAKLAQLKHDHRSLSKERKRIEDDLLSTKREAEVAARRLALAHAKISDLESQALVGELRTRNQALEQQLREALDRARVAEASLSECRALNETLRDAGARAASHLRELTAENEALETELASTITCPFIDPTGSDPAKLAAIGLSGKRILCVGGRTNLVQHYRALVERHGGELLHHDGGLEESLDAVTRAMTTVDAVLCPIDCVSHAATLKVKRACKHLAKDFVVLRSSGLSSFARAIRTIALGGADAQAIEG